MGQASTNDRRAIATDIIDRVGHAILGERDHADSGMVHWRTGHAMAKQGGYELFRLPDGQSGVRKTP